MTKPQCSFRKLRSWLLFCMAGVGERIKASFGGRARKVKKSPRKASLPLVEEPSNHDLSDISSLKDSSSFILQPSLHGDLWAPMLAYEVHNEKRFLLFKAIAKRHGTTFALRWPIRRKTPRHDPIHLADLRGYRILSVFFPQDDTPSRLKSISGEAVVECPPGVERARVTRHVTSPTFTLTSNKTDDILFSLVASSSSYASTNVAIFYQVVRGLVGKSVGHVSSKTGLTLILHLTDTVSCIEKALLLALVIALDTLKDPSAAGGSQPHRALTNAYELN